MDETQSLAEEINQLKQQTDAANLPPGLYDKVNGMLHRLNRSAQTSSYNQEYERVVHYLNWIVDLPWQKRSQDQIDLTQAKQIMDKHHYGLDSVKQRFLEHLAVLKLNYDNNKRDIITRAPILCLVGLAGTGKTTFAYSLAEAMNRQIARIPFGGLGAARDLRGQSRLHLEAEPGYIIKALRQCKTRNPVFLLDEIDRVAEHARADVMGVLLELLDPGQNQAYVDHYIDYPVNLNEVLFIATSNNLDNLSTAVVNRLEVIQMPSYSDDEKIVIGRDYLLPTAMQEASLAADAIVIPDHIWPLIVRPLGYDSGIRGLKRAIDTLVRKVAYLIVTNQISRLELNEQNLGEYIEQYY